MSIFYSNPTKFSADSIPDQSGKTIIVTGGNTGIGYETVLELARKRANVYLAARSENKAKEAIAKIKSEIPNGKVTFLKLDLQDLKQIVGAAKEFMTKEPVLDTLVNNAGVALLPFALTKDGIETTFQTNHVGPYLFTRELMPALLKSKEPRIVNVSSKSHETAPKEGILFDRVQDEKSMNERFRYSHTKLANILFSRGLNKRFGEKVFVNSLHPGVVNTDVFRNIHGYLGIFYYPAVPLIYFLKYCVVLSASQGALTSLYCATSPDIVEKNIKAQYFVPFAKQVEPTDLAKDDELAERLWVYTEKLVNEKLHS